MNVDQRLQVDTRVEADRTVLELHGELDLAGAPMLSEEIERAQAEGMVVVLDLEDLQFIDSAGLRVLLAAHDRAQSRDSEFVLTPGSPQVQRLLKVAGVSGHLKTVASPDAAIAGGQSGTEPA